MKTIEKFSSPFANSYAYQRYVIYTWKYRSRITQVYDVIVIPHTDALVTFYIFGIVRAAKIRFFFSERVTSYFHKIYTVRHSFISTHLLFQAFKCTKFKATYISAENLYRFHIRYESKCASSTFLRGEKSFIGYKIILHCCQIYI